MSLIARSPSLPAKFLRVSRIGSKSRSVHIENKLYENMPFSYDKKGPFAVKLGAFLLTGFSIPFIATWWQLRKSGGAAA